MRKITTLFTATIMVASAGCGSSSSSSTVPVTSKRAAAGVNPNQRETLPPGDIPDTIAYVPYTAAGLGLTLSTPEGWSRENAGGTIKFTDKLNAVQVFSLPAAGSTSAASAKTVEVPKLASSVKGFTLQSVSSVSRPAGRATRIVYLGDSRPNAVTGKVGTLAFERYEFFHKGREIVLLLSSPNGSDNVDPWRKVTSSLRFTR